MIKNKQEIVFELLVLLFSVILLWLLADRINNRWVDFDWYSIIIDSCILVAALTYGLRSLTNFKKLIY